MNEIDVFLKIQKISKRFKEGDEKSIVAILNDKRSANRIKASTAYKKALKIISTEMNTMNSIDINLFILFAAFYYHNIYDIMKTEWLQRVKSEIRAYKLLKSNPKKYFFFTLKDLIGDMDIENYIKTHLIGEKIIKLYFREDITLTYLTLLDYFFDIFETSNNAKHDVAAQYWSKYENKYNAIKSLFGISDKNENIKQLKEEILSDEQGLGLKITEIKMYFDALTQKEIKKERNQNSLLSRIKSKNRKISNFTENIF